MDNIRFCFRYLKQPKFLYLTIFLGAFGFFFLFHKYDFFMEDEGLYLYETLRVYKGQLPYQDFRVGYTPLGFYLYSLLFYLFGPGQPVLRIWICFINASSALLLFILSRKILPLPWAIVPSLLFLCLKPETYGSSLWLQNTPYFAWNIVFLWLLGVWFLCQHLELKAHKLRWLFLCGLINGAIFSFKANAGIFNAWLILLYLIFYHAHSLRDKRLFWAFKGLLFGGIFLVLLVIFKSYVTVGNLLFFILPLLSFMAILLGFQLKHNTDAMASNPTTSLFKEFGLWLSGFLIILLPWVLYLGIQIGWRNFLDKTIFQNTSTLGVWYLPFSYISKELLIVTIFLYVAIRVFRLIPRPFFAPLLILLLIGTGLLISQIALPASRGWWRYFSWQIDIGSFYLVGVTHWLALFIIYSRLKKTGASEDRLFILLTLSGLTMILQVYPRMDIAHLMPSCPATLILMAYLLYYSYHYFSQKNRWVKAISLVFAILLPSWIVFVKTFPIIWELNQMREALSSVKIERAGARLLDLATINFYQIPQGLRDRYKDIYSGLFHDKILALKKATEYIQAKTPEGSPLFAFPASPILYFLTNRDNPTKIDYFRPQVITDEEEKEVVEQLKKTNPPYIVMGNGISIWWLGTENYYPNILNYVKSHYYLEKRFGKFDILKRSYSDEGALRYR